MEDQLSVREIQQQDISKIIDYWITASNQHLEAMGVALDKMPTQEQWVEMLTEQLNTPMETKKSYCLIWLINNEAVGHCNVNKIVFGQEAYMHLHMWNSFKRKQGYGSKLVKLSLPIFFKNLQLQTVFCEPYALNDAPNRTLQKLGFEFVKAYTTTPGAINFQQPVKCWKLDYSNLAAIET